MKRSPRSFGQQGLTRRTLLGGLTAGTGMVALGCSQGTDGGGQGAYPLVASSVSSADLNDYNLADASIGSLQPGRLSPSIDTPLGPGDSFRATYSARSLQGNGQALDGEALLRFERLPVLGTRGIIASTNDGRTGVAAHNNTQSIIYRVELVPADAPVFGKTNGGWEFLQTFPGGWQPGEGLFLVGLRSDLPRGEYKRRYRSIIGYDKSNSPIAISIAEEVEEPPS